MYVGLYQGSAAMTGLEKWQGVISQNIANSGVAGYKAATVSMTGQRMGAPVTGSDFGEFLQNTMLEAKPTPDFSQGQFVPSDNPLDVAIDGEGFFEIEQAEGPMLYTRDGQFHLNADNVLVNKSEQPVMGTSGEIQLIPGAGEPSIDLRGRVFQGTNQVGELSVVQVRNLKALDPATGGFTVRQGEDPQLRAVEDPRVLQGYVESSNVSPVREMVALIAVTRAFEANEKIIQTHDRQLERAITTLGTV